METLAGKAAKLKGELEGVGASTAAAATSMAVASNSGRGGGNGRRGGGRHGDLHAKGMHFGFFGFTPATIAGGAAAYGAYESYKQDATFAQAYGQFQSMNLGQSANASALQYANTANTPGISRIENLRLLRDATVIMKGNYKEGEQIAPALAQIKYTSNALGYATSDEDLMKILRVAEMRGGFKNPSEMADQLAYASQGVAAFGGTVTPKDFQNFMRTGGVAALSQSDKTFWLQTLPIIQELGGNRTGTALMSLYSALGAGRTTTAAAKELDRLGLIKKGYAEYNTTGMIKRIRPGGIVNNEELSNNFVGFLFDTLFPALEKKGITDPNKAKLELATILPNRTASNLAAQVYMQHEKIVQEYGMASNAMNFKQQKAVADSLPQGQVAQFDAAASNLGVALGRLLMPSAIAGMKALTAFLNTTTFALGGFSQIGHGFTSWKDGLKNTIDPFTAPDFSDLKRPSSTVVVHHQTIIDGKVVTETVNKHQGQMDYRSQQSAPNYPNLGASPLWSGYNGK